MSFPALGPWPRFLRTLSCRLWARSSGARSSRAAALAVTALCALASSGCSSDSAPDAPGGVCNVQPKTVTGLDQTHLSVCSEVSYPDNPPAGGHHYSVWAAYQSYSFPVPRGFWVHDLEHGAIVFSYNCTDLPDGCAEEVAQVQALIDALPVDLSCPAAAPRRVVLTPDPLLDVRWGVSAWGFTLRADCVDEQRFRRFYANHYGQGPEDLCAPGEDFGGTPPCE